KRPAEIICGIVYRYFRAREDSIGTAMALDVKPPAVRQTLLRLHRTWERIVSGTAWPCAPPKEHTAEKLAISRARRRKQNRARRIVAAYKEGKTFDNLKAMFGAKYPEVRLILEKGGLVEPFNVASCIELYRGGMTNLTDLAERMGY